MLRNEGSRRATKSETSTVAVILRDKYGAERRRTLHGVINDSDQLRRKTWVEFVDPPDIAGVQTLAIARDGGQDDERWIYLPAIAVKKRIGGAEQTTSFMGTDFSFEDFSIMDGALAGAGREYKVTGEETKYGHRCWVIESWAVSPQIAAATGYGKRLLWVEQEHFIAVSELMHDKESGQPIKELVRDDIRPAPGEDGAMRPHRVTMKNLKTGHSTELDFLDFVLDREFDSGLFDPANLQAAR